MNEYGGVKRLCIVWGGHKEEKKTGSQVDLSRTRKRQRIVFWGGGGGGGGLGGVGGWLVFVFLVWKMGVEGKRLLAKVSVPGCMTAS